MRGSSRLAKQKTDDRATGSPCYETGYGEEGCGAIGQARQLVARLQRINLRLGNIDSQLQPEARKEGEDGDKMPSGLLSHLERSHRLLGRTEDLLASIEGKLTGGYGAGNTGNDDAGCPEA